MKDYNPGLTVNRRPDNDKGSPDSIEVPDQVENIGWQTRAAVPTEYEYALADALQAAFAEQVYDLPGLIDRLNQAGISPPAGVTSWTEEAFQAEMRRLGA